MAVHRQVGNPMLRYQAAQQRGLLPPGAQSPNVGQLVGQQLMQRGLPFAGGMGAALPPSGPTPNIQPPPLPATVPGQPQQRPMVYGSSAQQPMAPGGMAGMGGPAGAVMPPQSAVHVNVGSPTLQPPVSPDLPPPPMEMGGPTAQPPVPAIDMGGPPTAGRPPVPGGAGFVPRRPRTLFGGY